MTSRLINFIGHPGGDSRFRQKLSTFYGFAEALAGLSTCKRLQVGSVIVTADLTEVVAIGYNGPCVGRKNDSCRMDEGGCGCTHSESNAIAKLATREKDLLMLVTASPCEQCAGLILNCQRVSVLIYGEPYRVATGLELLSSVIVVRRFFDLLS